MHIIHTPHVAPTYNYNKPLNKAIYVKANEENRATNGYITQNHDTRRSYTEHSRIKAYCLKEYLDGYDFSLTTSSSISSITLLLIVLVREANVITAQRKRQRI